MQFMLYCLCGGIGVSTDYLLFYLSVTAGVPYQASNALGYLAGTLVSFGLNRVFTFSMRDRVLHRMGQFVAVATVGFTVSALLLLLMVQGLSWDARVAKVITLPVVVALQFILNKHITFRAATRVR